MFTKMKQCACVLFLAFLAACGGGGGGSVVIEMGEVHVLVSLLQGNEKISFAPQPAAVNAIHIRVTGEGMAQPVNKLLVRGVGFNDATKPISIVLPVPTGANRTFIIKAFDTPNETGTILFQGSATHVAISLEKNDLDIALLPPPRPLTPTATLRTITKLDVTPVNPSIAMGAVQQFIATGRFSDGTVQDLTASVQWHSLAVGVTTIDTSGLATGVGAGSSAITATFGPVTGVAMLVVIALPATPFLSVTPDIKQLKFSWTEASGAGSYNLMENPDGLSGFVPVQSDIRATTTAKEIAAHKYNFANARYLISACNVAGCRDSNEVHTRDAALGAIGYFKASNTGANDQFGLSVAVSGDGNTLAVAAPLEDGHATSTGAAGQADNTVLDAGSVYIFTRSGPTWSQQAYVKASNAETGDAFGQSIALSSDGNTLAVGAPLEDSAAIGIDGNQADNGAANAGAVYIFVRSGAAWSQQAYIKASNARKKDKFGQAVSLSGGGNTLVVGAPLEDSSATGTNGNQADRATSDSGAVYVFARSGPTWNQQAYVKASNTGAGDFFGQSVSLSGDGNMFAVGASLEDGVATGTGIAGPADNLASNAGAVYIFAQSSATWSQQAYVKAANAGVGDSFGQSVSLSETGHTLAVGAHGEDGIAVGINGDQRDNRAADAGATYIFTRSDTTWSQEAYIKASNTEAGDSFGQFVALSGDGTTLAVGASMEDSAATGTGINAVDNLASDAGAVYIFTKGDAGWSQRSYVKASNTGSKDKFGAVSLNRDGNTLAVGAPSEESLATGIGGNRADNTAPGAGAVYLY